MAKFEIEHPDLVKEIVSLPAGKDLSSITSGSGIMATWICKLNHEYTTTIRHRVYGRSCPYCAGSKVLAGFNDIATTNPELLKIWSSNNEHLPETLSIGTKTKITWECENGHTTVSKPLDKLKTLSCFQCREFLSLKDHPLYLELDSSKNSPDLNYSNMSVKSSYEELWWLCEKQHSYNAVVRNRYRGRNCPFCSGKKVLAGFNDIATTNPELLKIWDDKETAPETVSAGSDKIVKFKCVKEHSYKKRISETIRQKNSCPFCSGKKVLADFNDIATTNPEIIKLWDDKETTPETVSAGSNRIISFKCENNHEWSNKLNELTRNNPRLCPLCTSSNGERELFDWVKSLKVEVERNSRSIIKPLELDIYLPDFKLAIEYNGLYWHSENVLSDKNYHLNKTLQCKEKGIFLLHIWEDDWLYKKDVVKKLILNKLGLSNERKVNARQCKVKIVEPQVVEAFMNNNHIQGYVSATIHVSLFDKDDIVAVASFKQNGKDLQLVRYATNANVRGGFSKILNYVVKTYNDKYFSISTFADLTISNGRLYENTGFKQVKILKPDYKYVIGTRRVHKFGFRKEKFKKNPKLFYQDGLTESQLAKANNLLRIWDCGKIKYVFTIK